MIASGSWLQISRGRVPTGAAAASLLSEGVCATRRGLFACARLGKNNGPTERGGFNGLSKGHRQHRRASPIHPSHPLSPCNMPGLSKGPLHSFRHPPPIHCPFTASLPGPGAPSPPLVEPAPPKELLHPLSHPLSHLSHPHSLSLLCTRSTHAFLQLARLLHGIACASSPAQPTFAALQSSQPTCLEPAHPCWRRLPCSSSLTAACPAWPRAYCA